MTVVPMGTVVTFSFGFHDNHSAAQKAACLCSPNPPPLQQGSNTSMQTWWTTTKAGLNWCSCPGLAIRPSLGCGGPSDMQGG